MNKAVQGEDTPQAKIAGEAQNPYPSAELLQRVVGHATNFFTSLPARPVRARGTREDLLRLLDQPLTDRGEEAGATLDALVAAAEEGSIGSAGPRYFGFVIGGSVPAAVAADWMTSVWDQNAGLYACSPLVSVAEEVANRWLLELLGLPREAAVGYVTGGQTANLAGLAAARHEQLRSAGWNVEEQGLQRAPELTVVVSEAAHVTIFNALRILGLGAATPKRVKVDAQDRMIAADLERVLGECRTPTIVCAQAGCINTGAFDPLAEIAPLTKRHGAWLHVDGAFGLWAAVSPELRPLVKGMEQADSWATDAHKWLNVPYDCGIAIVRTASALRGAFASMASYLVQSSTVRDPMDYVPEFSRRGRSLTVYAALRSLGRSGVRDLIERCCGHARLFAELLGSDPRVQVLNEVVLNQTMVRFSPPDGSDADEFTREVIRRVQEEGTCWLAGTQWRGMAAMRISVSNWSTTREDVVKSAKAILKCRDEAAAERAAR